MKYTDKEILSPPRLKQEAKTIEVMIRIYCRAHHQGNDLCQQCLDLLLYSRKRLRHCIFQEAKPVCGNCTVHCYKKEMQEKIREVMRYAGPRMVYRHPAMAMRHLLEKWRKTPALPEKKNRTHPHKQIKTNTVSKGGQ